MKSDDRSVQSVLRPGDGRAGTLGLWAETALGRFPAQDVCLVGVNEDGTESARYSGAELIDSVTRLSAWLQRRGAGPGKRVGVLSGNAPEFIVGVLATWIAGCAQTLLNTRLSDDELAFMIDDSEPFVLLVGPGQEERSLRIVSKTVHRPIVLCLGAGEANASIERVRDLEPFGSTAAALTAVSAGGATASDPASVAYTGGTTGRPKAVVLSNAALQRSFEAMGLEFGLGRGPFLHAAPLVHGTLCCVLPVLASGAPQVTMAAFRAPTFLDLVRTYGVKETLLAPSMLYMILAELPQWEAANGEWTGELERVLYGGSAMHAERAKEAIERFGPIFHQFYGQGECPMMISTLRPEDHHDSSLRSAGRPTWLTQVALVDDEGNEVPRGDWGEIVVRSPMVMEGYLGRAEETQDAFAGGVLHTGDIGYLDADGFLFIVDRKKDMIVTGGYNVFSAEVEGALSKAPGVHQVCVVGVDHPVWGESIHAIVVPSSGATIDAADLEAFARASLPSIKVPKSWEVVDEIPLTPIGKYDKKLIRSRHNEANNPASAG